MQGQMVDGKSWGRRITDDRGVVVGSLVEVCANYRTRKSFGFGVLAIPETNLHRFAFHYRSPSHPAPLQTYRDDTHA